MLEAAIKAKLLEVLEGDLDANKLRILERIAHEGRGLLLAISGAPLPRDGGGWLDGGGLSLAGQPLAPAAPNETFGSTFMRDIMEMYPKILEAMRKPKTRSNPADLMQAILDAEKGGKPELAALLTRRLRDEYGDPPEPVAASPWDSLPDEPAALPPGVVVGAIVYGEGDVEGE